MANLNDPVVGEIVKARVRMLFHMPFFGNLATRLNLVEASSWCATAATDGRSFYYNRDFIMSLTPDELVFLLAHEVCHAVYDHLGRRGDRDPKIWNAAIDYITNYTLVKEKVGDMPKGGLYDEEFTDEMTSEEVYRLLEKNSTKVKVPLDMHLDATSGDGDDSDGDGNSVEVTVMGGKDGPPKLTEEDIDKIRNEIRAAVINAAQSVDAGKIPAGIARLIDGLTNPIMDWRSLLEMHIQSSIKDDFTFQRPSRRSWSTGVLLPGQNFKDMVEVSVAIDTSGSMTDEMLRDFLSEVKGIMDTFEDFELWIWTFDTQVYNPVRFTPQNADEILTYKPQGGGGTLFECNWEFMRNPREVAGDIEVDSIEPKKFVMFTDGYPAGSWGEEEYCDTLFVIHGNKSIKAPFGLTAYYEEKH